MATSVRDTPAATRPRVDVGIPTVRRPEMLAEAIGSVLAQTFEDWQLVISIEDHADTAVSNAIRPFVSDPRVNVSENQVRLGLARHKTKLLQFGTAPYIAILDDDDFWAPSFLEEHVAAL